jgi:Bacterial SH3 domain
MTRTLHTGWRLSLVLVVLVLGIAPASSLLNPEVALAQSDLSADPKAVSPTISDLRTGFQFVPEKSEQREPVPGIIVYEADFVRDQTKPNFANGPIEIKSLVAKTANASQAAEQFTSSRQALTTASPAWVESKVAKLGDEATGLTMEGTSSEGPAVAHLYLFRRGAMVVGITVAGLTKPTRMAEAEAIAAVVLRKIDPAFKNQTGSRQARQLNTQRPAATATGTSSTATGTTQTTSATSGQRVRVANTGGTNVRLRLEPSLKGQIVGRLAEGTVLEVVGEDRTADGFTWKNVRAPGDGRGWVAGSYVVPVTGSTASSGSPQTATAASPPSSSTSSPPSSPPSSSPSSASASNQAAPAPAPAPAPGASTTGETLKVDVSAKQAKLRAAQEQVVEITVTKNGSPVADAQVTVKTSPTGETPAAPKTDSTGKTRVTWNPSGAPGFIGVGVSALGPDGSAGVGGASFEITGS